MLLPRFYPILDVVSVRQRRLEVSAVARQILEAGAAILQFRYKGPFTREVFGELEQVAESCRQAGAILVVNDRADVAKMIQSRDRPGGGITSSNTPDTGGVNGFDLGVHHTGVHLVGVHLGQEDLAPSDARRVIGSDAIIGYSTHNEKQLRDAESQPADYLAFGPIFGTRSKENPDPVVGLEELRRLRPLISRPLVAIGGITRANARSVIDAGADSVAVIGDLFHEDVDIRARAEEWLQILNA